MEPKLKDVKVGDKFLRMLGGELAMPVVVATVKGAVVVVRPDLSREEILRNMQLGKDYLEKLMGKELHDELKPEATGWYFSIHTGCEIDVELGWDGLSITGSYLVKPE